MSRTEAFVFDFDSTLVTVESFDELLGIALEERIDKAVIYANIEAITEAGMNGEIDLLESLTKRLQLVEITQSHIDAAIELLKQAITPGMADVVSHLKSLNHNICIMSGGFTEMILPVAQMLDISPENIFANQFCKSDGIVTGIDFENPLSRSSGKAEIIVHLKSALDTKVTCIGDGMSDAIPYLKGVADEFWGFFQNKDRPSVREKAPHSFDSSTELLSYVRRTSNIDK